MDGPADREAVPACTTGAAVTALERLGAPPLRELAPGLAVCAIVAAAAGFLSEQDGAPVMLFALLHGLALNYLSDEGRCRAGIEFGTKALLRVGVALFCSGPPAPTTCSARRTGGGADRGGAEERPAAAAFRQQGGGCTGRQATAVRSRRAAIGGQ
jgi:hypothetical protein